MGLLRALVRLFRRIVPANYSGRRDRLNDEQDQLTMQNNFRSGM